MIVTNLGSNLYIPDTEKMLLHLEKHAPYGFDIERFKTDFIAGKCNTYYFDSDYNQVSSENASNLWIQLPITSFNGNPLFLSMRRDSSGFRGDLVGEHCFLTKLVTRASDEKRCHIIAKNLSAFLTYLENPVVVEKDFSGHYDAQSNHNTDAVSKIYVPNELATEIKNILLIDHWETFDGFRRFLLTAGIRANSYVKNNKTDYYIINKLSSIVINTGLLNKYGQCINIMYRWHVKAENYVPYKIIDSKAACVENDFTIADANKALKPISFFDEATRPFVTDISLYDNSIHSLKHCTDETRRDRFPESVRDISDLSLTQKIQQALNIGLEIHRSGGRYAKPIYKSRENTIHWLLPLHINADINDAPELVMVISEKNGFYDIRTVLPYNEEVRDRVRAVQPYENLW